MILKPHIDNFSIRGMTASDGLVTDCSSAAAWTINNGIAFTDSTEHNTEGTGSVLLTIPDSTATGIKLNTIPLGGVDMSGNNLISFKIGFDVTSDTQLQNISFQFLINSNAGNPNLDYLISKATLGGTKTSDMVITFDLDSATDFPTSVGSFDRSSVEHISIRINNTNTAGEKKFYLDGIYHGVRSRTKVMMSMDDGHDDVYSFFYPACLARNLKGGSFVNMGTQGTGQISTTAQMQEMRDNGWFIGSHGLTHTGWDTLSKEEQRSEYVQNKELMIAAGFGNNWRYHAFVGGQWTDESLDMLEEEGCIFARTVEDDLTNSFPDGGVCTINGLIDKYKERTMHLGVGHIETASAALALVDEAIAYGYSISIYGHQFVVAAPADANEFLQSEALLLLDGLKERQDKGLIDTITYKEYVEGML